MAVDIKQAELNRIVGMIKIRDYVIVSTSFKDDQILIQAEKLITPELLATKDTEATWITNFLKSQGWVVQATSFPENKIVIQFVKEVKV